MNKNITASRLTSNLSYPSFPVLPFFGDFGDLWVMIAELVYNLNFSVVYDTCIVIGVYKPTYNCGGWHSMNQLMTGGLHIVLVVFLCQICFFFRVSNHSNPNLSPVNSCGVLQTWQFNRPNLDLMIKSNWKYNYYCE